MDKYLIVNADDFAAPTRVNRVILECHAQGVVASTSLMVTGRAAREIAAEFFTAEKVAKGLVDRAAFERQEQPSRRSREHRARARYKLNNSPPQEKRWGEPETLATGVLLPSGC